VPAAVEAAATDIQCANVAFVIGLPLT
jgi:hypothetical protein